MSALTHRECLRAALLDAIGGEPCTDLDGERSMARASLAVLAMQRQNNQNGIKSLNVNVQPPTALASPRCRRDPPARRRSRGRRTRRA